MKEVNVEPIKRTAKQEREHKVLIGLVEQYLETGKPVGSNTLKEAGFQDLSSATIRNYFSHLEEHGYLVQQHTSGGRIPTDRAFRLYAEEYENQTDQLNRTQLEALDSLKENETREIATFLQNSAETLSNITSTAVFLSAPRFDQDFVLDIKLVDIDHQRCLGIIVTDFGLVQPEILYLDAKLSTFSLKRIESYFHWRVKGQAKPQLSKEEELLAQRFYNELMVRFIVNYSSFTQEEIYRTGFSKLLGYPEFKEPSALSNSLALFENVSSMRLLLRECQKIERLKFWIGHDLTAYSDQNPGCSVLAVPYYIQQNAVGAIGLLGPLRLPYRQLFSLLRECSQVVSETLSRSVFKHKITFRQPQIQVHAVANHEAARMLIEDKRK